MAKRNKNRITKKIAEKRHAQKRAEERYQLVVNGVDFRELQRIIANHQFLYREKITNRVILYIAALKGKNVAFLWDRNRKMAITFLPEQVIKEKGFHPENLPVRSLQE